jgi:quinoprotein glucose dehydrogenase
VRQEAQFALAAKGQGAAEALSKAAREKEKTVPRLHAVWGLGQVAAKAPEVLEALIPLVKDKDLEVRSQAAKVLGEGKSEKAYGDLVDMLKDPEPRARFFAAMALGKIGKKEAVAPILTVLKENADNDGHLRHACVQALAWISEAEPLVEAAKHESPSVRLGAVLALRKMQHGDVAAFLQDKDRVVMLEAARAIHDVPIEFAMEQLAAVADQTLPKEKGFAEKPVGFTPATTGGVNDWILWRATNANYRLGTPEGAQRLAKLAANDAVPTAIRVEALRDLGDWETPPGRDRIMNLWRPMAAGRDAKAARDAAAGVVEDLAKNPKTPNAVRVAATNLMRQLGLGDPATLAATVEDASAAPDVRVAALASLVARKDQRHMMKAIEAALKDKDPSLRREATRALANVPGGVKRITDLLERGSVADKQAALSALAASPGNEADPLLVQWMDKLIANQVPPELHLDLLEAAEARNTPAVKEKLAQHKSMARNPSDALSYFRETLAGGDAEVGRRIFRENAAVSCMRCHAAEGEGGIVGPNLNGLATRQNREYILESIVAPNAKIAEGFETVVVQTKDTPARYRTGVLKKEDDKELVLMNPDAEPDQQMITIPKDNIASRERGPSAMPEGLVKALSKRELRDLVEYLASRKEPVK